MGQSGSFAHIGMTRFMGLWNASTNAGTGSAVSGGAAAGPYSNLFSNSGYAAGVTWHYDGSPTSPQNGDYWQVHTAGSTTINSISSWDVNDWIIYSGSTWIKLDVEDTVASLITGFTTPLLSVAANGNVGIGTTSADNPLELLSSTSPQLRITHTDNVDYATLGVDSDGQLDITTVGAGVNISHICLLPEGNVGIGTSTPASALDVKGDGSAGDELLRLVLDGDRDWVFGQEGSGAGTGLRLRSLANKDFHLDASAHIFRNASGGNETLRIDPINGKVGINTTSPDAAMDIKGDGTSGYEVLRFSLDGDRDWSFAQEGSGAGTGLRLRSLAAKDFHLDASAHVFRNASGGGETLRVDTATGRVGIGASSPASTLHVAGEAAATGTTAGAPAFTIVGDTDTGMYSGGANALKFSTGGTLALTISSAQLATFAGAVTITGDLTVNGTTTTVNSTVVTIDDPIFTLGGESAPGSDDNKDRGIEFRYHNGSAAKVGFFGWDDSASAFTFIADATNSSEVFSGTAGNVAFGNIAGTLTTAAQPNITSLGTLTALAGGTGDLVWDTNTLVVDSSADRVGIGTTTPSAQLDIHDTTTSSAQTGGNIRLSANDGQPMGDSHRLGVVEFTGAEDTSNTQVAGARIEALTDGAWTNVNNPAALYFYVNKGDNTAPLALKLDNNKNATFGGVLSIPDGTAGAPSLTNTGDTNCGLFFSAADVLSFTAGGTAQFTMADGVIAPVTDSDVDLGTSSLYWKNAYIDAITTTGNVAAGGTLAAGSNATVGGNLTVTGTSTFNSAITSNSGVVVDNITIDGTEIDLSSGDLTIDVAGDIVLDADGGQVTIQDDGADHFKFDCDATAFTIYDDQDTGDLFSITVAQHGATTLATTDDDATAAHLTLDVDGDIILDADGGDIYFKDDGTTRMQVALTTADSLVLTNSAGNAVATLAAASTLTALTVTNNATVSGNLAVSGTSAFTGAITSNAGVVVDNITIDGTEIDLSSGDLTIDVAGDIELNADGGEVTIKDDSATVVVISNQSGQGELRLHEAANYVGFKAPALSGDQIYTLPAADGSNGQQLTTNGSGVLSWAAAGSGGGSSAADDISAGDAAVSIETTSGNITLDAQANDADVIIKVDDGGTSVTAVTFDGSDEGNAIFVNDLKLSSDASAIHWGANNEITLSHEHDVGLVLTHTATGDNKPVKLTLKSEEDAIIDGEVIGAIDFKGGDSGGTDAILVCAGIEAVATDTHAADNNSAKLSFKTGASEAAAERMAITEDGHIQIVGDNKSIEFGADEDIKLTHVHNEGLALKHTATGDDKPIILTLQTGETDMAANDVIGKIAFQAPDEGEGTDAILVAAGIQAVAEGDFSASSNATRLEFMTAASEAASAKMTLSSTGLLTISDDLIIKDGGTIGSASDTDAIGISSGGIVALSATTDSSATNSGTLVVAGGVGIAKDVCTGNDIKLLSDSAVVHFGANSEITLTHVHDEGLALKHTATGDDKPVSLTIQTGETTLVADEVLGSLDFQAPDESSGTDAILVAAGIEAVAEGAFSASSNACKLSFKTASSEAAAEKMSLSSAGLLTVSGRIITDDATDATSTTDGSLQTDGGLSVAKDAIIGNDLYLLSDSAVLGLGAGKDATFTHDGTTGLTIAATPISIDSTGELHLNSTTGDVKFQDGGTDQLAFDLDGTAGAVIMKPMVDSDDLVIQQYDGTEVIRFTDGADVEVKDDLYLKSDSSVIHFGADSDIALKHVPDVGLVMYRAATGDQTAPSGFSISTMEAEITIGETIGSLGFTAIGESSGGDANLNTAGIMAVAEDTFTATANPTTLHFATAASSTATSKMNLSSTGVLSLTSAGLVIPDDGTIGSASDTDAIKILDDGDVEFTQDIELIRATNTANARPKITIFKSRASNAVLSAGDVIGEIQFDARQNDKDGSAATIEKGSIEAKAPNIVGTGINAFHTLAEGAAASSGGTDVFVMKVNGEIVTTILVDITDLVCDGDDNHTIGDGSGAARAYLTQITEAINGVIYRVEMNCVEVPAGSNCAVDIDLSYNSGVLAAQARSTVNTNGVLAGPGGSWTKGTYMMNTPGIGASLANVSDAYLYLTNGSDVHSGGTYTAGKFIIKLYGANF